MTTNVTGDREEAYVHLDLAGQEHAIVTGSPCLVERAKFLDRRIKVRWLCAGFLHRTFHQTVREGETARQGNGGVEDIDGRCFGHGRTEFDRRRRARYIGYLGGCFHDRESSLNTNDRRDDESQDGWTYLGFVCTA